MDFPTRCLDTEQSVVEKTQRIIFPAQFQLDLVYVDFIFLLFIYFAVIEPLALTPMEHIEDKQ